MSKDEFFAEEHEHEARIERHNELQSLHHQQALQRQRMMNGGYTDEELMDFDEEDAYGIL